jgi:hypothetical protein
MSHEVECNLNVQEREKAASAMIVRFTGYIKRGWRRGIKFGWNHH